MSFWDFLAYLFTQIKGLVIPGSLKVNCTQVDNASSWIPDFDGDQPNSKFFLTHLSSAQLCLLVIGSVSTLTVFALGAAQAVAVCRFVSTKKWRKLLLVLAFLFPGSAGLALTGMYIPRAATVNASLSLFVFIVAIAALIRLCKSLTRSWDSLAAHLEAKRRSISVRNPPFCCILPCLPSLVPTTRNLRMLELAVLQAPFVRGLVIVTQIVALAEYREDAILWLQICDAATLVSLLLLVFGFHTLSRAAEDTLKKYSYTALFRLVDLGLLFSSAQEPLIFENVFVRFGAIGCTSTLLPHDQARFICNFVIIIELLALSILACLFIRPATNDFFDRHPSHANTRHDDSQEILIYDE